MRLKRKDAFKYYIHLFNRYAVCYKFGKRCTYYWSWEALGVDGAGGWCKCPPYGERPSRQNSPRFREVSKEELEERIKQGIIYATKKA